MTKLQTIFNKKKIFFIAEIGLNHNGSLDIARQMLIEASKCGADAVKFQTFVPDQMNSVYTDSLMKSGNEKQISTVELDFFSRFILSKDEYIELLRIADKLNILLFSSPFDVDSVDLLETVGIEIYKIASSEVTNHILLSRIAKTKKPVIMSTGISSEKEIAMAINILNVGGTPHIILMHCVSLYPLPLRFANLKRIASLRERFNLDVGFSDHTRNFKSLEIAAAYGARIFEKHFTINKDYVCPDQEISITPHEFIEMRKSVDVILEMTGDGHISYDYSEKETAKLARRSLFARRFIEKGKILEHSDIIPKRPGIGIPVYMLNEIIGKKSGIDIMKDFVLKIEYFE